MSATSEAMYVSPAPIVSTTCVGTEATCTSDVAVARLAPWAPLVMTTSRGPRLPDCTRDLVGRQPRVDPGGVLVAHLDQVRAGRALPEAVHGLGVAADQVWSDVGVEGDRQGWSRSMCVRTERRPGSRNAAIEPVCTIFGTTGTGADVTSHVTSKV